MNKLFICLQVLCMLLTAMFMGFGCSYKIPSSSTLTPHVPHWPSQDRIISVSAEQVKELATLMPGNAARADVVKILGEPSWESRKPTQAELEKALGKEKAQKPYGERIEEDRAIVMMQYNLGGYSKGKEVRFLMVFLEKGLFTGYIWEDSAVMHQAERLTVAKELIDRGVTGEQLRTTLGPPARIGDLEAGQVRWQYKFWAPETVKSLGLSVVTFGWIVTGVKAGSFFGMEPEFIWYYENPFMRDSQRLAFEKVERDHYSLLQMQKNDPEVVTSGPEFQRIQPILNKLRRHTPLGIEHVELYIRLDDKPNAGAGNGPKGAIMIINSGLVRRLTTDDELAGVVAHELGHIIDHHSEVPLKDMLFNAWMYKWHRTREHAADIRGVELMARAGYDPLAAARALKVITAGDPAVPKDIDTHPPGESRQKLLMWYCDYRGFRK